MRIPHVTMNSTDAVVGVDDQHDLIGVRRVAVVVLVPDDDNCIPPLAPRRRGLDGADQVPKCQVTAVNERRVQPLLAAVVFRVVAAETAGATAAVLVVALARPPERKRRSLCL